jgi:hypothetical protein
MADQSLRQPSGRKPIPNKRYAEGGEPAVKRLKTMSKGKQKGTKQVTYEDGISTAGNSDDEDYQETEESRDTIDLEVEDPKTSEEGTKASNNSVLTDEQKLGE